MDFREDLDVAVQLRDGATEAEWRSATSRAYYAAFHVARQFLLSLGFAVPTSDRGHAHLWLRLSNAGDPDVEVAGNRLNNLNNLRGERISADYDGRRAVSQRLASRHLQTAEQIVQALDAAAVEPTRTRILDAMKVYERDGLHDVTWRP
jgi:uncharacterized protein (UPF0332 family)